MWPRPGSHDRHLALARRFSEAEPEPAPCPLHSLSLRLSLGRSRSPLPLLKHTERRRSPCPPLPASGASTPPVPASCCVLLARPTVWLLCFARVLVRSSIAGDHSSPRAAMDASQAKAQAAAARARGLAAAPCHGASGAQPRARCGHPVSRGSSSPPVVPHSVAAVSLRAAEPHAHVASRPRSTSG